MRRALLWSSAALVRLVGYQALRYVFGPGAGPVARHGGPGRAHPLGPVLLFTAWQGGRERAVAPVARGARRATTHHRSRS